MTNIASEIKISKLLQTEFDKTGFESCLYCRNGKYTIVYSVETPHHYMWVGELELQEDLERLYICQIAEDILNEWKAFDPKYLAKELQCEIGHGGFTAKTDDEIAEDIAFIDQKLEFLIDNISNDRLFGNKQKVVRRISRDRKPRDERDS